MGLVDLVDSIDPIFLVTLRLDRSRSVPEVIDSLGFGRLWLIRWRSLRFAESIFGAMVLGLPNGRLRKRLPMARYANDVDDYRLPPVCYTNGY